MIDPGTTLLSTIWPMVILWGIAFYAYLKSDLIKVHERVTWVVKLATLTWFVAVIVWPAMDVFYRIAAALISILPL